MILVCSVLYCIPALKDSAAGGKGAASGGEGRRETDGDKCEFFLIKYLQITDIVRIFALSIHSPNYHNPLWGNVLYYSMISY